MATYRDSEGNLYWFDILPPKGIVRDDLVQLTEEEEAALAAQNEVTDE